MQPTEFGERGTESIPSYLSWAEEDTQKFWKASSKGQGKSAVNLQRIFFSLELIFSQLNQMHVREIFHMGKKRSMAQGQEIQTTFFGSKP